MTHISRSLSWFALAVALAALLGCSLEATPPLRIVVADPLADRFCCECAPESSYRTYDGLDALLQQRLRRRVRLDYTNDLATTLRDIGDRPAIVIAKTAAVEHHADAQGTTVRLIARLTDAGGDTTLRGLFVVRKDDPARTLADLAGRTIALGPKAAAEKHDAAIAALSTAGITPPTPHDTRPTCVFAAIAVHEDDVDAAVISSYASACLDGGPFIPAGALRVVGTTEPVPFIGMFATRGVSAEDEADIVAALERLRTQVRFLEALRSRDGFVATRR